MVDQVLLDLLVTNILYFCCRFMKIELGLGAVYYLFVGNVTHNMRLLFDRYEFASDIR